VFTGSPEELPVWKMKGKNAPKLGKMNGSRSAQLSSPTTFDAADSYAAFMVDISVEWNGLLNYKPNKPTYMWREPTVKLAQLQDSGAVSGSMEEPGLCFQLCFRWGEYPAISSDGVTVTTFCQPGYLVYMYIICIYICI